MLSQLSSFLVQPLLLGLITLLLYHKSSPNILSQLNHSSRFLFKHMMPIILDKCSFVNIYTSTYILYMLHTTTCRFRFCASVLAKGVWCAKNFIYPSNVMFLCISCEKPQCDKTCTPYGVYDQIKCIKLP